MLKNLWTRLTETDLYFSLFKKKKNKLRIEGSCRQTGNCCRNLILVDRGKPVTSQAAFEKLKKKFPVYEMFQPNGSQTEEGYLRYTCTNLRADNKCGIYESRPALCRRYPHSEMVQLGGGLLPGCGYRIVPEKGFDELLNKAIEDSTCSDDTQSS